MEPKKNKALAMGQLRRPEPDKKKIAILIAVIAVVCLSASAGLYYVFKDKDPLDDEFGPRRRGQWRDVNMPNPEKQSVQEILAYRDSDAFKRLSQQEQFMYSMASGRQVREYQMQTYFSLPQEGQAAYLDKIIDEMQALRQNMEQMRQNRPPRPPPDANDPNVQRRRERAQQAQARRANPANMRARSERGTALQRAQREQFMQAMQKRMKERGITMPAPGRGRPGRP